MIAAVAITACVPSSQQPTLIAAVTTVSRTATSSSTPRVSPLVTLTAPQGVQSTKEVAPGTPDRTPTELKRAEIISLIQTNPDCRLPCFWGILPGESAWGEANSIVQQLGLTPTAYPDTRSAQFFVISLDQLEQGVYQDLRFYVASEIVTGVRANIASDSKRDVLKQLWSAYSPEFVLQEHGAPDRVFLGVSTGGEGGLSSDTPYTIWVFYDRSGFALEYYGATESLDNYQICPTFSDPSANLIGSFRLYIADPMNGLALEKLVSNDFAPNDAYKRIRDVAELDERSFHAMMTGNGQDGRCFNSPSIRWLRP